MSPASHLEVKMMVGLAAGVEPRLACRAHVAAVEVLPDRQVNAARSAEHAALIEGADRPDRHRVICDRGVARVARVVLPTALELDRNDVELAAVVSASGAGVDIDAEHLVAVHDD